jgi:hypothetical protein
LEAGHHAVGEGLHEVNHVEVHHHHHHRHA